ncbi:MAG TPA: hypothetical protein VGJ16_10465 [Pirellulales bacterium]|jgi:hypothetical protein
MSKSDKALIILLRLLGIIALLAFVPLCMPFEWMAAIREWLELGPMPDDRVTEYLARTVCAFYASYGLVCLALAADLDRYRPLVRLFGLATIGFGLALVGIDMAAGMPVSWTWSEGPPTSLAGIAILLLARED